MSARKSELVAVNERGVRIGETHHLAVLTDDQVDEMRDLYEAGQEGTGPYWGYRALAKKFKCAKGTVRRIVHYEKRVQYADRWKRIDKK